MGFMANVSILCNLPVYLLSFYNLMFRVGARTQAGSGPGRVGKPETHIHFYLALMICPVQ